MGQQAATVPYQQVGIYLPETSSTLNIAKYLKVSLASAAISSLNDLFPIFIAFKAFKLLYSLQTKFSECKLPKQNDTELL